MRWAVALILISTHPSIRIHEITHLSRHIAHREWLYLDEHEQNELQNANIHTCQCQNAYIYTPLIFPRPETPPRLRLRDGLSSSSESDK